MTHTSNYKIVLLGDVNVGKTSITNRYIYDTFDKHTTSTIGASYYRKTVDINYSQKILEIWDTTSSERFNCLLPIYYRNTHAAIIVYDITSLNSYNRCKNLIEDVRNNTEDVYIILVGNKSDLIKDRIITYDEGLKYSKDNDIMFIECSAATGDN